MDSRTRSRGAKGRWVLAMGAASTVMTSSAVVACAAPDVRPPDRSDEVATADAMVARARFDTIAWLNEGSRVAHGNGVYAAACTECHGYLGDGVTEYATRRGLKVPSLVRRDWRLAGDIAAVRARVFSGHAAGMPTWGLRGDARLSLRDVDAVAFYVMTQLRDDALAPPRPTLKVRR